MYIKVSTGSSFGAAAEYDEKGLSKEQRAAKAGKVEQIATYNLLSTDARGIGFEMSNVAAFSRAEKPVWNVSISAGPGQQLSNQQWQQVAEQYLRGMKADPDLHQIAIWRHHDTNHDHIHVLLNSVPIGGGPALSRQYTGKDAQRLATEIDASLTPGLVQQVSQSLTTLGQKLSGKETVAKPTGVRVAIGQAVARAMATRPTTETELVDRLKAAGVSAVLLGNSTTTSGINFVLNAKPHQPIKGSLIKLAGGSTAKWGELARQLDANRQAYEAEIERLKSELDETEAKRANAAVAVKTAPAILQTDASSGPVASSATGTAVGPTPGLVEKLGSSLSTWSRKLSDSGVVAKLTDISEDLGHRLSGAWAEGHLKLGEVSNRFKATIANETTKSADAPEPTLDEQIVHQIEAIARQSSTDDEFVANVVAAGVAHVKHGNLHVGPSELTFGENDVSYIRSLFRPPAPAIPGTIDARPNPTAQAIVPSNTDGKTKSAPVKETPSEVVKSVSNGVKAAGTPKPTLLERFTKTYGFTPSENALERLKAGAEVNFGKRGKTVWLQDGRLQSRPYQAPTVTQNDAKVVNEGKPAPVQVNAPEAAKSAPTNAKPAVARPTPAMTGSSSQKLTPATQSQPAATGTKPIDTTPAETGKSTPAVDPVITQQQEETKPKPAFRMRR